jgi:hypothetical protein
MKFQDKDSSHVRLIKRVVSSSNSPSFHVCAIPSFPSTKFDPRNLFLYNIGNMGGEKKQEIENLWYAKQCPMRDVLI